MGQDMNNIISDISEFQQLATQIIPLYTTGETGEIVKLNVRVKRTSLQALMKTGKIPDTLLSTAQALSKPNNEPLTEQELLNSKTMNDEKLKELLGMQRKVAEELLIEPTYAQIEQYLDDDMVSQIVKYATGGLKDLERFHTEQGYIGDNNSSRSV